MVAGWSAGRTEGFIGRQPLGAAPAVAGSVFVSQLGKGGSWEFKRQAGNILGVGNLGALASRIAWELGGRVGAQKSSLGALKKVGMEQLEVGLPR